MSETQAIRVLIADDEPGMRMILRKMISRVEGFALVGEAADGAELMRLFEDLRPQVVFLDVDMPVMNGVACANRIQDTDPACVLIFATAHEEYRSDAFAVYAFDYLLKPFKMERVIETLTRIRTQFERLNLRPAMKRPAQEERRKPQGRMMIKHRDGVAFISMADILLVQREERSTVIYTADGASYATADTLSETEAKLDPQVFFRCHRSYIINLNRIRDITPYGRWTYVVRLDGTDRDALITQEKYEELERMFQ
ncbi:MAG: response regulator transcription factor [Clostridia bacterium]|nr:response regulator transcription factor [Clostridia bacterium]